MTSIGDTLRRERQRRNLDLPKIAGELKISTRFLEAMEQDEFAKLPGGVFTRSFVRQYASFLGLDAEELVQEMEHAADPEPPVSGIPDKSRPAVPGIDLEMGDENWQSVRERRTPLPSWVRAGVLLVVLTVVCSGVYYWWWQRPRHQVLAHETQTPAATVPVAQPTPPAPRPAENPPAVPAVQASLDTAANTSADPSTKPAPAESAAAPPAATPEVPVAAPNPNATVRVGITADEAVWVRADVNGKYQFSGTLQPHESRNIDADGEVTLRLGNAGGATLTLNGKPVGAVGPKGQIRIVQFTSGGFQIVSAPKLLDPLDRL
jgi:cytoskeleton protein RodZ